jgi:glycosyltransferase involved in cell wall biosynthesis
VCLAAKYIDFGDAPHFAVIRRNGKIGILVPLDDVQAMAAATCQVLVDTPLAKAMQLARGKGSSRVSEFFRSQDNYGCRVSTVRTRCRFRFHS